MIISLLHINNNIIYGYKFIRNCSDSDVSDIGYVTINNASSCLANNKYIC